MQINSNTFKLEKEAQTSIESVVRKVAEENNISNVESVSIDLSKEDAVLSFVIASDSEEDDKKEKKKEEKKEEK